MNNLSIEKCDVRLLSSEELIAIEAGFAVIAMLVICYAAGLAVGLCIM